MKAKITYDASDEVIEIIKSWQFWLRDERGFSKHTLDAYSRDLSLFFAFISKYLGHKTNIESLISLDVRNFRAFLSSRSSLYIEKSSIARELSSIKNFFKYLAMNNIAKNDAINVISSPRINQSLPKAVDVDGIFTILEILKNNSKEEWQGLRDIAIITILYGCGLRISEALSLNYGDIDHNDFIKIKGKGNKERIVPLLPIIIENINTYINACPYNIKMGEPLFLGSRGERLNPRIIQRRLEKIRHEVGLPDTLTPHALRHSFATHLLAEGTNLRVLQELLGHASLSTTQRYTDLHIETIQKEYNKAHPLEVSTIKKAD